MDRLTTRNLIDGEANTLDFDFENAVDSLRETLKKLATYEDAEEKGDLIFAGHSIDEYLYAIVHDDVCDCWDISEHIITDICLTGAIVTDAPVGDPEAEVWTLEDQQCYHVCFSEEKAESALQEINESQNKIETIHDKKEASSEKKEASLKAAKGAANVMMATNKLLSRLDFDAPLNRWKWLPILAVKNTPEYNMCSYPNTQISAAIRAIMRNEPRIKKKVSCGATMYFMPPAAKNTDAPTNLTSRHLEEKLWGVSDETRDVLDKNGIETVGDLASKSCKEILEIRGIGQGRFAELQGFLSTEGLDFRED